MRNTKLVAEAMRYVFTAAPKGRAITQLKVLVVFRLAITCISQATIAASQKEGVCSNDDGVLGVLNSSNA